MLFVLPRKVVGAAEGSFVLKSPRAVSTREQLLLVGVFEPAELFV